MKYGLTKIFNRPVLLQFVFWTVYYFFDLGHRPEYQHTKALYLSALAGTLLYAAVVNVNVYFLLPKLTKSNRYLIYFISLFLMMLVSAYVLSYADKNIFYADIDIESIKAFWNARFDRDVSPMKFFPLMGLVFFSTLFVVSRTKSKKEAELHEQKISNELKILKQQINPHFLFNALNNVYSLSYLKSEATPQMILKLSDMLRYVLYECSEEKVTLEKEIEYIKNYISFQTLKSERHENLELNLENVDLSLRIEPMLFIPFIENSFKHSKIEDLENSYINLNLKSDKTLLEFEITNSIPETVSPKDKTSGIGLENVKRRLELLYPNKHELLINKSDNSFNVLLKVELT